LPEGIGVVPVYLNFKRGTEDEFRGALNAVEEKVAELAEEGVDLIHPEGAPPFMVHGYKGEDKIIKEWESKYKVPMVTAAQTQVEALRALKVKKFVGVTYFVNSVNDITTSYFRNAGFDVMAMEGISVAFEDVGVPKSMRTGRPFEKPGGGIYILGTGWLCLDIIICWKKTYRCRLCTRCRAGQSVKNAAYRQCGFSKLLEEMP
jgi:hypothetical protein